MSSNLHAVFFTNTKKKERILLGIFTSFESAVHHIRDFKSYHYDEGLFQCYNIDPDKSYLSGFMSITAYHGNELCNFPSCINHSIGLNPRHYWIESCHDHLCTKCYLRTIASHNHCLDCSHNN